MIDTLVLRLHKLKTKYPKVYEQYYAPTKGKNSMSRMVVDEDTGELQEKAQIFAYVFHDTNRVLPINHRATINIASSHYSLSYIINTSQDFIEFNFSLPKLLYSTNVMQFINMHDQSCHVTFRELRLFMLNFVSHYFIDKIDLEDVEINRIDLCYNQFFNSMQDAMNYLDEQKQLNMKYARSSQNKYRNYDTSLMYVTRRYSFKIYHKGTEFRKNDYKELVKNKNPKNLPLQKFLDISDCILRYEMTFRTSMLNYLMQHYMFVSKAQALYPKYSEHIVSRTFRQLIALGDKKIYEDFKTGSKMFTLKSMFDLTTRPDFLRDAYSVTLDETIFEICHKTFFKKVKDYQLSTVLSTGEVVNRIEKYNEDIELKNKLVVAKKKLSPTTKSRMIILALLASRIKLEELKNYLPSSSYYDMMKIAGKLGITAASTSLTIPQPKLDYSDYKIYFSKYH